MAHHVVTHLVHVAIDERAVKNAVLRQRSVKKTNAWSARPFVVLFKVCLTDLNQETVKLSKERQISSAAC